MAFNVNQYLAGCGIKPESTAAAQIRIAVQQALISAADDLHRKSAREAAHAERRDGEAKIRTESSAETYFEAADTLRRLAREI